MTISVDTKFEKIEMVSSYSPLGDNEVANKKYVDDSMRIPPGMIAPFGGLSAPGGWLLCAGSEYNITQYEELFDATLWNFGIGTGDGPVSNVGSGTVFSISPNNLDDGDVVYLRSSGTLPTGVGSGKYYVVNKSGTDFELAVNSGGTPISYTTSGAGQLDVYTTSRVPDLRGRVVVGVGQGIGGGLSGAGMPAGGSTLTNRALSAWFGSEVHSLSVAEMPEHTHPIAPNPGTSFMVTGAGGTAFAFGAPGLTLDAEAAAASNAGGNAAHNIIQPSMALTYIIKS